RRRGALAVAVAAVGALVCAATVAVLPGSPDGSGPGRPRAVPSGTPSGSPSGTLPGALPADADVPAALREPIARAARRCPEPEVTPVLLAAMLKAESGFDPKAARPETGEYGIAMWTPAVFNAWAQDGDLDGRKDYMSPPDAIISMGSYVCWLAQQFKRRGLTDDLPGLLAAGYRTSDKSVAEARGVPERVRPHVAKVEQYLAEYSR
ncbi:transglycosylase SLT domain-containing protein, partial [Kitasatospora sp. NPDC007106]|uniref:transglycosylase SLT domain-containing protein n=1 Tax=Kitasatospora sp. NPDC007106 TaxID=3156914 RepID=UPI003407F240